jgi:hypothetical protein
MALLQLVAALLQLATLRRYGTLLWLAMLQPCDALLQLAMLHRRLNFCFFLFFYLTVSREKRDIALKPISRLYCWHNTNSFL